MNRKLRTALTHDGPCAGFKSQPLKPQLYDTIAVGTTDSLLLVGAQCTPNNLVGTHQHKASRTPSNNKTYITWTLMENSNWGLNSVGVDVTLVQQVVYLKHLNICTKSRFRNVCIKKKNQKE